MPQTRLPSLMQQESVSPEAEIQSRLPSLGGTEIPFDLPEPEPEEEPRDYGWGITTAFKRGFERLRSLPDVAQGDYEELAQHFENMEKFDLSEHDKQRMQELQNTEGWWEATAYYFKNPSLIAQIVAESLPMSTASIGGGIAGSIGGGVIGTAIGGPPGGFIGAIVGRMTGAGAGSYVTEYLASITEYFGRQGIDATDAEQLKKAFNDPKLMEETRQFASERGVPIGIFDALSFGLAGRIYRPTSALVKGVTGKVVGMTGEISMQASAGMAGEAGAQLRSVGEIEDIPGVIAEGFGEIVPGFIEQGANAWMEHHAEQTADDALSKQLLKDVSDKELDAMSRKPDALSMQAALMDETQEQIQIRQYEEMTAKAREETEGRATMEADLEATTRREEERSQAWMELEQQRETGLARQRETAEYQRELEKGEVSAEIAPVEEPITAPKISIPKPTEQVTGEAPGVSLGEAITEAQEKQAAEIEVTGREVKAKPLTPPEKPSVSRPTKAINLERDSFLVTRAKSPANKRLSQKAFLEEGLDIESMREKVYASKPAFSRHPDAMTPDDVAEYLNEQGYLHPEGKKWDVNSALDAITEEVEGRTKLFTDAGMETVAAEEAFSEAYGEYERAVAKREQEGVPKTFEITVDGVDVLIEEDPNSKSVEVTIGESVTITNRKKGETNADLVRTILKVQKEAKMTRPVVGKVKRSPIESDIVEEEETIPTPNEARAARQEEIEQVLAKQEAELEREAIQTEEALVEEVEPDIPGFEDLEAAAQEAATSPTNELKPPTKAQKEAGNYRKGHLSIKGLPITIENPVGSSRRGFKMKDHYGYIKRTEGVDGDQVDVFVNPDIQTDYDNRVYVIDQTKEDGVTFDEHKVMLGYKNQLDAVRAYKRNYEKGWKVGPITEMSMSEFKIWLAGDTKQPVQSVRSSRHARKFVRTQKGLRYSLSKAKKALREDAQAQIPGVNQEWVEKVVGAPSTEPDPVVQTIVEAEDIDTKAIAKRAVADRQKADREAVDKAINRINKVFPGAKIRILENIEEVWNEISPSLELGVATPSALYRVDSDEILIFRNKIHSADNAVELALHEMFHKGGRTAFGEKFGVLLDDLAKNLPEKYKAQFAEIKERYRFGDTQEDVRANAEELIAALAQSNPKASIVKRFVAAVRRMFRKAGFVQEWTDNDIISMIAEAHGALARKQAKLINEITLTEEVQHEETSEIFDIETNAEIVLRQHDKRTGVIEKLRACL